MTTVMMMWFKMSTVKTMTLMNVCCIVCVCVCACVCQLACSQICSPTL